jgi:nucleoside-diphosphate-sugar epimerase
MESEDPDLEELEQLIPPEILGYPWSKWACEQIALKCSAMANIPVAISLIFLPSPIIII